MQLIEILRGKAHFTRPLKAQPLDVTFDRINVFLVFFGRVGVVKTQMGDAAKFLSQPKVHANGLGVTDVQVAVGLRREAGHDLFAFTRVKVRLHDGTQEISRYSRASLRIQSRVDSGLAHRILERNRCAAWVGRLNQSAYHSRCCQVPDRAGAQSTHLK